MSASMAQTIGVHWKPSKTRFRAANGKVFPSLGISEPVEISAIGTTSTAGPEHIDIASPKSLMASPPQKKSKEALGTTTTITLPRWRFFIFQDSQLALPILLGNDWASSAQALISPATAQLFVPPTPKELPTNTPMLEDIAADTSQLEAEQISIFSCTASATTATPILLWKAPGYVESEPLEAGIPATPLDDEGAQPLAPLASITQTMMDNASPSFEDRTFFDRFMVENGIHMVKLFN
jgi:hypothetical protein